MSKNISESHNLLSDMRDREVNPLRSEGPCLVIIKEVSKLEIKLLASVIKQQPKSRSKGCWARLTSFDDFRSDLCARAEDVSLQHKSHSSDAFLLE